MFYRLSHVKVPTTVEKDYALTNFWSNSLNVENQFIVWAARLCRKWLSLQKAIRISYGVKTDATIKVIGTIQYAEREREREGGERERESE